MAQIKHNITISDKIESEDLYFYYFNFIDYVDFLENSDIYIKKNDLFFIKPNKIYTKYNNIKKLSDSGLLHVVNIQRALGMINKSGNNIDNIILVKKIVSNILKFSIEEYDKLYLLHDFYQPAYMLNPGWISGMAQGMFASLLIRIWILTKEEKYIILARKSINVMITSIENNGCAIYLDNGIWFEEYVNKNSYSYVLNGHIFSLLGLFDYNRFVNKEFENLLNLGIQSCLIKLKKYCSKHFSYYDLCGHIADYSYHTLHLSQLKLLFMLTNNRQFLYYYNKFVVLDYTKSKRSIKFFCIWLNKKIKSVFALWRLKQ